MTVVTTMSDAHPLGVVDPFEDPVDPFPAEGGGLDRELADLVISEHMTAQIRRELETVLAELATGYELGGDWSGLYPTEGVSVKARRMTVDVLRDRAGLAPWIWAS